MLLGMIQTQVQNKFLDNDMAIERIAQWKGPCDAKNSQELSQALQEWWKIAHKVPGY